MEPPRFLTKKIPNPIKIIRWLKFNPVLLITNAIKAKRIKKERFLMGEYESGRILQVDNNKDNKQFLLKLETA